MQWFAGIIGSRFEKNYTVDVTDCGSVSVNDITISLNRCLDPSSESNQLINILGFHPQAKTSQIDAHIKCTAVGEISNQLAAREIDLLGLRSDVRTNVSETNLGYRFSV